VVQKGLKELKGRNLGPSALTPALATLRADRTRAVWWESRALVTHVATATFAPHCSYSVPLWLILKADIRFADGVGVALKTVRGTCEGTSQKLKTAW